VVIKAGTPHTVANVSEAAGTRSRLSLAGFFVRPDGVHRLIQEVMNARRLRDEQPT
jgi:Rps23 Pro-64 3,4-dihydroxylase Tpa1-like proline 4-hydroxylase